MKRSHAIVLRAFAIWTVWVWGTRIWNIWGDDSRGAGFKAVHTVLAVVSVAFAVATWRIVSSYRADGPSATSSASVKHRQPPPALRNSSTGETTTSNPHASS